MAWGERVLFSMRSVDASKNIILPVILRWRRMKIDEHLPRDPAKIYVWDLIRCPLKRRFELEYPELVYSRITSGRTFLGDMVHLGLETLLKSILGGHVITEAEDEERITRERPITIDNTTYTISGRIDAILTIEKDGEREIIGVEIKETTSTGQLPYPHHIEQCRIYNWLYGFSYTVLLYITPDGLYEFTVADRADDREIEQRVRELLTATRGPKYDWECDYCEFRSICSMRKLKKNSKV